MVEQIPIPDRRALDVDSLSLSRFAMTELKLGSATQTLSVLRSAAKQNDGRTTFIGVGTIADRLVVSPRQVHRHLERLAELKCIDHLGRQLLPGSKHLRRRTVTYAIDPKVEQFYTDHGFNRLPLYLLRCFPRWADRAVLAAIINRAEISEHCGTTRDTFSLNELRRQTGLTRQSVIAAKRYLHSQGIILAYGDDWNSTNLLTLNDDCLVTLDATGAPIGIRPPSKKAS